MNVEAQVIDAPAVEAPQEVIEAIERDFEAEARSHGWTPKDDFKGDPSRWVDAETFVRRADEVMPFLKKQNQALKRDLDEAKRTMKQLVEFQSKAEERAYNRALKDIEARHAEAVETGDVRAAKAAVNEMRDLEKEYSVPKINDEKPSEAEAGAKLAAWVDANPWYVQDEAKRRYADIQAQAMGSAIEYEGGPDAWLAELGKRVERQFATPKPSVTNGGGNRPAAKAGGRSYADLPADAKRQCDRFMKQIPGFTKEAYVRDYAWDN